MRNLESTEIICPYCFAEQDEESAYSLEDGDSAEMTCKDCELDFILKVHRTVRYSSKKINDDDEASHDQAH